MEFFWSGLDLQELLNNRHPNSWNTLLPRALGITLSLKKKMREKWGFKGFIPSFPGDIQVQWESSDRNGSTSRFSRESKASLDGIWSNLVGAGMGSALSLSQPNHSKDLMKCGKTKRGRFEGSLEGTAGVFQEIHFYGNFGYWE